MADRSIVGWETVAEYEADPIASDSANGKAKILTNLLFVVLVWDHQASIFGSTENKTASQPRINKTLASDFHKVTFPSMASFDACIGPVAPISDRGTRTLVVAKEGFCWRNHLQIVKMYLNYRSTEISTSNKPTLGFHKFFR